MGQEEPQNQERAEEEKLQNQERAGDEEEGDDDKEAQRSNELLDQRSTPHRAAIVSPLLQLSPPRSRRESVRDWFLRTLDRPFFQVLGLVVLFGVVADGAAFFFFLMGWQATCSEPSRTDCEPRNSIYNVTVQLLTWLFTYMAIVSMPWRCVNATHTFGWGTPPRDNAKGLDVYGRPTNEIWFHMDLINRGGIIIVLLMNCLLQFANQATRLIFYNYELQDTSPGNKWVNIFFVSSMVFAAIGAIWGIIVSERIRKKHPGRFGPGPWQTVRHYWRVCVNRCCLCREVEEEEVEELEESEQLLRKLEEECDEENPTRNPLKIGLLGAQRAGLRLFGL
jgi:hypothetical protein